MRGASGESGAPVRVEEEVRRVRQGRSVLSQDELKDLIRAIRNVICDEWPKTHQLSSETIYERLVEQGVTVPDYAMDDAFNSYLGSLVSPVFHRPSEQEIRQHGGVVIGGVNELLCDPDVW
jgi:hypothetical protein